MAKVEPVDTRANPANAGGPWKETLFGCFDDMKTCCCGFWCLPCLFGTNAEKIDGSSCVGCSVLYWLASGCYLCWVPHMSKRKTLRQKYRLKEDPCNDCLVTAFCGPCAVCQEAREIEARSGQGSGPNGAAVRIQQPAAYRR